MRTTSTQTAAIPIPQRFSVDRTGSGLCISWSWFTPAFVVLLVFVGIGDLVLTYFLIDFSKEGQTAPFFAYLFLSPFILIGFVSTYVVLAGLFNKTVVQMNSGELSVKHGPLPWIGNVATDRGEIQEVFCREKKKTRRDEDGRGSTTMYSYSVNAVSTDGRELLLASSIREPEKARFLEQEIQRELNLPESTVPGRYTGQTTTVEVPLHLSSVPQHESYSEFAYEAMDEGGRMVKGKLFAVSEADARKQVQQQGFFVTGLKKLTAS